MRANLQSPNDPSSDKAMQPGPAQTIYLCIRRLMSVNKYRILSLFSLLKSRRVLYQILFPKQIPIIINCFNRLSPLVQLIDRLKVAGYNKIILLDNHSTYPPLVEFYKNSPHRVIKLPKNYGHMALWNSGVINEFKKGFFIYTDPDVIPVNECPKNFVKRFLHLLIKYPFYEKVGFGLKIDDLPDYYPNKEKVLKWELQFWQESLEPNVFHGKIDTTFALYKPHYNNSSDHYKFLNALRTGGDLLARHHPWYANPENESEEEKFYKVTAQESASWTHLNIEGL